MHAAGRFEESFARGIHPGRARHRILRADLTRDDVGVNAARVRVRRGLGAWLIRDADARECFAGNVRQLFAEGLSDRHGFGGGGRREEVMAYEQRARGEETAGCPCPWLPEPLRLRAVHFFSPEKLFSDSKRPRNAGPQELRMGQNGMSSSNSP